MKITVLGGTGRAGARIVARLAADGHQVVAASRSTGTDALTGQGLDAALAGAAAVVDAGNAPTDDPASYFARSTRGLLDAAKRQGVRHHLLLSVVGADRMDTPYMRGKVAQEELVRSSGTGYTIVRATQFHEFIPELADTFADGSVIRVPEARMQPVALEDVAELIATLAPAPPLNRMVEIGGPEAMTVADAVRRVVDARVPVIPDRGVSYFGATLGDDTLLPGADAHLGRRLLPHLPSAAGARAPRVPE